MPFRKEVVDLLSEIVKEISWDETKKERFSALYDLVLVTNRRINITSITGEIPFLLKNVVDSLSLLQAPEVLSAVREGKRFCDVGCGGGFPGLPLAIALPDLDLTMIDSTEKKIRALGENAASLGLSTVRPLWGRGEELAAVGGAEREQYDVVVSRAVASLPVLVELCLPFVRPGGVFIAMKGAKVEEETEAARRAVGQLGGTLLHIQPVDFGSPDLSCLSEEEKREAEEFFASSRSLVVIQKKKATQERFPRSWAQMSKKPL